MRVIGSTTTLVSLMSRSLGHRAERRRLPDPTGSARRAGRTWWTPVGDRVRRDAGRSPGGQRRAEQVEAALNAEPADPGEPLVERRHGVPELGLGTADARMPGADGPAGAEFHWKIGQGENVAGPLHPTWYRHQPLRAASSSNSSTYWPAS